MRIVCLSDTHGLHDRLTIPDGDLLLHAGDATGHGNPAEWESFARWLAALPHRHKVAIAGNHDFCCERHPAASRAAMRGVHYLQDELVEIEGLRIWGSPWQPWFYDWAFNLQRGREIAAKWALIPDGIDILVTHGPPMGILDRTANGDDVGCEDLRRELGRVRPRLHVFGHIHEAYGERVENGCRFVNASNCTLRYEPRQPPIVVDL